MGFEVDKIAPEAWKLIPKDVYFKHIFPYLYPMALELFASWNDVSKNLVNVYYTNKLNASNVLALVEKDQLNLEDAKPQSNFYPGVVLHKRGNNAFSSLFELHFNSDFPENLGVTFENRSPLTEFIEYCAPPELEEPAITGREDYKNIYRGYLNLQLAIFTHSNLKTLEACFNEMLPEDANKISPYACSYLVKRLIEFACNAGNQLAIYFLLFGEGPRGLEKMQVQEKIVEKFQDELDRAKRTNRKLISKCLNQGLSTKDVDWWFKQNKQAFFQAQNSGSGCDKNITQCVDAQRIHV